WRAALADYGGTPDEGRAAEGTRRGHGALLRDRGLTPPGLWLGPAPVGRGPGGVGAAGPAPLPGAVPGAPGAPGRPALVALAGRPEALGQPARFAAVFGQLGQVPAERRRAVLQSALRAAPGDLALLTVMGSSYPPGPRWAGERVRWFQAALAAHPR